MKILLCDSNRTVCKFWDIYLSKIQLLKDTSSIQCYNSTLEKCPLSQGQLAVVSPGNSFGYLGGGFDRALFERFGGLPFEKWFRGQLQNRYHPVNTANTIDLYQYPNLHEQPIRYLVHVPTIVTPVKTLYKESDPMRTGIEPVFNTAWAALVACPPNATGIIFPGLGTGYVGIPADIACKSMVFAFYVYNLQGKVSNELRNLLIMVFLGHAYEPFFFESCKQECKGLGIDMQTLRAYNAATDPLEQIVPPTITN